MTEPKETHPEITLNSHHHHHHHHHQPLVQNASHHHQQNPHQQNHQHHHYHHHRSLSASTTSTTTVTLMVGLILSTLVIALANGLQQQQQQPLPPISQILQDLVVEADGCGELHKDCHCGSIAQSPGSSLFTRLVYPNSSTVIEEYDDNVPYGYKLYRVYYQCADEENVLVGDNMRECAEGNWRGAVPRCVLNLRNSTKLKNIKFSDYRYRRSRDKGGSPGMTNESSASEQQQQQPEHEPINAVTLHFEPDLKMSPNGTFEIPLEEQPEKCISWGLFPEQVWSMTLTAPARIHYVRIKLNGDKIEDLHQSRDIAFEMSLKNITYVDAPGEARRERESGFSGRGDNSKGKQQQQPQLNPQLQPPPQSLPEPVQLPNIEIRCRETFPKASQYVNSAQQKYSANYLVLDFLCEAESIQKSIFEYFFSYDYAIDQLYAGVIEIRFSMLNLKVSPTSTSSRPTATSPEGGKAEGKSTSESSSGSKGADEVPHEEIELAQKIFAVRLCALKVYAFHTDCGSPDVPVNAIVQREYNFLDDNERKTYKYICNDKNQELKGNSFVECGYYSRWKNEFPQCVRFRPCELLSEMRKTGNNDYVLDVTYEALQPAETIIGGGKNKGGGNSRQVVPNGKSARFRCVKRSSMMGHPEQQQLLGNGSSKAATVTPPANVKASHVMYEGVTAVVCRNGQWVGLESAVNAHHCISVPSRTVAEGGSEGASGGPSVEESGNRLSTTSSTSATDPDAVVSLPIRLIRILFALFIILCLIIVALLVYMFIFRQQMNSYHHGRNGYSGHGSGKGGGGGGGVNAYNFDAFDGIGNHHLLNSSSHHLIPTIMYNGGADNGSSSGGANGDSSEIIYCTESNVYERISLEQEEMIGGGGGGSNGGLHFYQTIKIGGNGGIGGGGGDSNYSEMGTYPSSLVNEERENSIYGMEDDDEDEDGNGGSLRMIIPRSGGGGRRRSSANSAVDNSVNHNLTQQQLNVVRNAAAATAAAAANNYNQLDRSSSMFMKSNSIYENNSGSGEQQQQYH